MEDFLKVILYILLFILLAPILFIAGVFVIAVFSALGAGWFYWCLIIFGVICIIKLFDD